LRQRSDPLQGDAVLSLPVGKWRSSFVNSISGEVTNGPALTGGEYSLPIPRLRHDLAVRITRWPRSTPPINRSSVEPGPPASHAFFEVPVK